MKILIIEDDIIVRRLYTAILEEQGWQITHAENGFQGLKVLSKYKPDVILLDLLMPRMNGFAFLDELEKDPERSQIPVIVMTAKDLSWDDFQQLDRRVRRIFRKSEPGSIAELVPAIRSVTETK
jgi:CheY-like chemotaxis protein